MSCRSRANGLAQLNGVNLRSCRTTFNQRNVLVIQPCMAGSIKSISNTPACRHKAGRLLSLAIFIMISTADTSHFKTTHMTRDYCNPLVVQQVVDATNRPASGTPRVLVQKVPPMCHLVSIDLATEFLMSDCLEFRRLGLSHPCRVLSVHREA